MTFNSIFPYLEAHLIPISAQNLFQENHAMQFYQVSRRLVPCIYDSVGRELRLNQRLGKCFCRPFHMAVVTKRWPQLINRGALAKHLRNSRIGAKKFVLDATELRMSLVRVQNYRSVSADSKTADCRAREMLET